MTNFKFYFTIFFIFIFFNIISLQRLAYEPPPEFCFNENLPKCEDKLQCDYEANHSRKRYQFDTHIRHKFVGMLNHLRNIVACGSPPLMNYLNETFPKSRNMTEIVWNYELEWSAKFLDEKKNFKGGCFKTPSFPNAYAFVLYHEVDNEFELHYSLTQYFSHLYLLLKRLSLRNIEEYNSIVKPLLRNESNITYVGNSITDLKTLQNLLNDRITQIGCATKLHEYDITTYNPDNKTDTTTVCMVDKILEGNSSIYNQSEKAGSGCEVRHYVWKCLCVNSKTLKEIKESEQATSEVTNKPIKPRPDEMENDPIITIRPTCPNNSSYILRVPIKRKLVHDMSRNAKRFPMLSKIRTTPRIIGPFFCEDDVAVKPFLEVLNFMIFFIITFF